MLVFGGHFDDGTRGFWNDLWQLSLGDTTAWENIPVVGLVPGARSAFGTVYDPVRRRMLVHGGVNSQSGVEPDDLWALSLDGTPTWTVIATQDTLRGRSYPIDVYDPTEDRLLACGGGGYPQTSALSLTAPLRWGAVLPTSPLFGPSARSRHAVVHDARRDRFVVLGGGFSTADSAIWNFDVEGVAHWRSVNAPAAPSIWFDFEYSQAVVYDSLGDRIILFDGGQVWSSSGDGPRTWTPLGPLRPNESPNLGSGAAVAIDTRRNRLIVSGGWTPYPHSAGYTQSGVWSLSLGAEPSWSPIGTLPHGSASHASYCDPVRDRLVVVGGYEVFDSPRSRRSFGATVWSTPVDSALRWTESHSSDGATPAPPDAHTAFDPRLDRLFIARDSTVWTGGVDDAGPWTQLEFSTARPTMTSAVAYDPIRDQLLALFASTPGSEHVQAWAVAVGPLAVSLLEAADPASLRLALPGAHPNPAVGGILLTLSLPGLGPAELEIFDVRGRRRLSRNVGSLGPGMHSIPLEGSSAWPPGVYYARLRRGGESRTTRVVLIR
jgi:hypothetical protein